MSKTTSSTNIPEPVPADLPPAPPELDTALVNEHAEAVAAAQRAARNLETAAQNTAQQEEAVAAAEREERELAAEVDAAQSAVDRAAADLSAARDAESVAVAERERKAALVKAAGLSDEDANEQLLQASAKVDAARIAVEKAEAASKAASDRFREVTGGDSGHRRQWPPLPDTPTKLSAARAKLDAIRAAEERRRQQKEAADTALASIDEARERRRKAFSDLFPIRCSACRYWIPSGSPSRAGSGECHAAPPTSGSWPAVDSANACGAAEAIG